ncbi:MAG: GTP cyclohydrolase II [Anaerolineales bacterium]|nr:GTP cyclohydrolase II [Anaerolineales bacterium]
MMAAEIFYPVCARIPTPYGDFQLCIYLETEKHKEHLALIMGDLDGKDDVLVRVHSECFTGDVLGSLRCDCGEQLQRAMAMIAETGEGAILYLRQEGRGIGLPEKLRAYNLQDEGYDTVDANLALGHQADERDYTCAERILSNLGVKSIALITNNPSKIEALTELGIDVRRRLPLAPTINPENVNYISTKIERMRHLLDKKSLGTLVDDTTA